MSLQSARRAGARDGRLPSCGVSVVSAVLVFASGLVVGAALSLLPYVLLRRTTPGGGDPAAERVAELLEPLRGELERYDQRLTSFDRERAIQFGALSDQLHQVAAAGALLRDETQRLASALRAPGSAGRWGELQLKRVVELAGLSAHCDFSLQVTSTADDGDGSIRRLRPDLVVHLPGERCVVVDSKAPLSAYLDASSADDASKRMFHLQQHARQLRSHVDELARKSYWNLEGIRTPEFVVLFVPGEAFFAAALEHDATLLEHAAEKAVILATPATLIALLRAVAVGWREVRLADGAREISALGATLYERLATFGSHLADTGAALERAVSAYNRAVGSLETRVLTTARQFRTLGAAPDRAELRVLEPVEQRARVPQAPELFTGEPGTGEGGRQPVHRA